MFRIFLSVSLMLITFVSCTSGVAPTAPPIPAQEGKAPISGTSMAQEDAWTKLIAAARKEGRVSINTSTGNIPQRELSKAFHERYGITAEIVVMGGPQAIRRIIAERSAGIFNLDVYIGSATETITNLRPRGGLEPLEPVFMLPELLNPELIQKTWFGGQLVWLDRQHMALGVLIGVSPTMAINTELVKATKISYLDLLDPRWSEKIVLYNPTIGGSGNKWANMVGWKIMNWDYLKELVKQKPAIVTDNRLQAEWLVRGKYPIALAPQSAVLLEFRQAGAPVSLITPVEGAYLSVASGSVSLINKAPHPNAARLFINWLLSKEGGEVFSQAFAKPSARLDVTTEGIPSNAIPDPNIKYYFGDGEDYYSMAEELTKKTIEIFSSLMK